MLGKRIAYLRKRTGMSQTDLARRICVAPSTVGMYEQGRRTPSAATLVTLAELFQVSVDYLLTGSPAPKPTSREEMLSQLMQALLP